jgi:hypothetical protein
MPKLTNSTVAQVMHNPGCVPARSYVDLADVTIVFEDTFNVFKSRLASGVLDMDSLSQSVPDDTTPLPALEPRRFGIMIHSVPGDVEETEVQEVLRHAKDIAGAVFVSESSKQFYENFSGKWSHWVDLIGRGGK